MHDDPNYPTEIDLGRKESDMGMPSVLRGTKGKARKFYPTIYIDAVPGIEALPKEGCVMIKYRRTRLNIETPEEGEDKAGVTLEIQSICLADDASDEGDSAPKDLASVMDGKMQDDEEGEDQPDDETDEGE